MHPSTPFLEYFSLSGGYGPPGLRWSFDGEALETDDATWRFARQVSDFLEGFAPLRPVSHFALGQALTRRPEHDGPAARVGRGFSLTVCVTL